ncbi:MAG: hypothetical protein IIZ78_06010 [Clostridiales bacterium]|nr:hypothetical protein [Clostridiales bacterium]
MTLSIATLFAFAMVACNNTNNEPVTDTITEEDTLLVEDTCSECVETVVLEALEPITELEVEE